MQELSHGFAELDAAFAEILEKAPEMRREFHEKAAEMLEDIVNNEILASGLNDSNGRIRRWQVKHVGSGGGYAAVRPEKGAVGANSPGAITNYLENGHAIRSSSGRDKRYRPRLHVAFVNGYHFYENAASQVDGRLINLANDYADKIADILEGKT